MAAQGYSDISGLLTTFISVDSYAGGKPATSFGRKPLGANVSLLPLPESLNQLHYNTTPYP